MKTDLVPEIGDVLEVTYLVGKKKLGKYTVKAVYNSTFAAARTKTSDPVYFPNPACSNVSTTVEHLGSELISLTLQQGDDIQPTYQYILHPVDGEEL